MISTDENIFKEGSDVSGRIFEYGKLVNNLHVIVKTKNKDLKNKIIDNIFVYPSSSLFGFKTYSIAKSIIKNNKDLKGWLVTCQDPFENGLVGYFLKHKLKIPLQLQVHTDFLSPYFWQESLKNKTRVVLAKWLVTKADGVRVVSERIKKSLIVNCKLKIENSAIAVLPIFIDTQKIKGAPLNIDLRKKYPSRFIILMASRLTKEKNIGLAIEAMTEIIKINPEALLLIVGNGLECARLKLQVTNCKLQNFVFFEPWSNDLNSYYKTADLFLLTSNYEGYGMTAIEATAAGLPVVMTDVGISIGAVSVVGDYKGLVSNIIDLIKNPEKKEIVLKEQESSFSLYNSKEEYLNLLKASWLSCLSTK